MAMIHETATWENEIYLIDPNDPVEGGKNGVDNKPHQQLANRTAYLKNRLDNFQIPADNSGLIEQLSQRIEQLENANLQIKGFQIPIGGLFETTINYQNGDEVTTAMGYGRWELYGKGRVTVGLTTTFTNIPKNAEEHSVKDDVDNLAVFTIGETFGEFSHQLTVDEMPSHNHTKKDYNTESYNKEGYNGDKMFYGNPGTGEFQGTFQTDYTGKNQSHNNIQPSIVVGRWKRIA